MSPESRPCVFWSGKPFACTAPGSCSRVLGLSACSLAAAAPGYVAVTPRAVGEAEPAPGTVASALEARCL